MATFKRGDMLSHWNEPHLFLITTNACINSYGGLVMGAGIARQVRDRFSGIDKALAEVIQSKGTAFSQFEHNGRPYRAYQPPYYLLISPEWPQRRLGIFQVKNRFFAPAIPNFIEEATRMLSEWCQAHPDSTVYLNFPGIGNGGLDRNRVLPIVSELPDTVTIWEYSDEV